MMHVAKQLGIPSARLRKICMDYAVPLPPPGYWTQRAQGKEIASTSLPSDAPTIFGRLNSALRRFGEVPLEIADAQIQEFNLELSPVAGAQSEAPWPSAERLSRQIAATSVDADGFVKVVAPGLPILRIGAQSSARTVKMFSAFLSALDQQGFAWTDADDGQCIQAYGEFFTLKIYETRFRFSQDRHAHKPSGKLCMEIVDARPFRWGYRNLVGQWHDRKVRPIETCLADALTAVSAAAGVIKLCRERAESEASRLTIEARRLRVEETSRPRERALNEYLLAKARAYAEYVQLVAFSDFLIANANEPEAPELKGLRAALRELLNTRRSQFAAQTLHEEVRERKLLPKEKADSPSGDEPGP